tara:strand:- start:619 stop:1497 length:879 start_codon:yes stop_codon:yes gene_type:complete
MAIKTQIAFEGLTYNLDDRDRVAMKGATQDTKDGAHFKYSEGTYGPSDLIVGAGGSDDNNVKPFSETSTQLFPFGAKLIYGEKIFRYAGIAGTSVTAGKCVQVAAATANHRDKKVDANTSDGATSVGVRLGATAAAANLYKDGYLHILSGSQGGQLLKIKSHDAVVSAGTGSFSTYDTVSGSLEGEINHADLMINPYNDLVVAPTSFTGPVVGVTPRGFTADYYGWIQTGGPCSVLLSGTVVLGQQAVRSDTLAGAVEPLDADEEGESTVVGQVMVVNDTTEYGVVWLNLDS